MIRLRRTSHDRDGHRGILSGPSAGGARGGESDGDDGDERTAVFVSYSRKDERFVDDAKAKLEELDLEVWLDLEDIPPSSNWRDEIRDGIEGCDALIVVISPESMTSAEVGKEIDRAEELGKRIVPVERREYPPESTPDGVSSRNWIRWRSDDDEADALAKIDEALTSDPAWAKEHTRLNGRALRWERHGKDHSRLLRGNDLETVDDLVFFGEDILFAGDHDGRILMWDVPAGRTVGALTGPADAITSLALDSDARVLAAAGEGDRVWVWDLDVEEWVDGACRVAGRNMTDLEWAALQLDDDAVAHCADVDSSDRIEAVYPGAGEGADEE